MGANRRDVLKAAAGLPVLALTPYSAALRAELTFLAGMTALEIGAAVVGIIGGIAGMVGGQDVRVRLKNISDKLDTIMTNQARIMQSLEEIKLVLSELDFKVWETGFKFEMMEHKGVYTFITQRDPLTKQDVAELRQLLLRIVGTMAKFALSKAPVFPSYAMGIALMMLIARHTDVDQQSLDDAFAGYRKKMMEWDAEVSKMITDAKATEYDVQLAALKAMPMTGIQTGSRFDERGRCSYKITNYLDVSGSFEAGFSVARQYSKEAKVGCEHICRPIHCMNIDEDVTSGVARAVAAKRRSVLGLRTLAAAEAAGPGVTIPEFQESGVGYVNDMNRRRIAIYQVADRIAKLEFFLQSIRDCHAETLKPIKPLVPIQP